MCTFVAVGLYNKVTLMVTGLRITLWCGARLSHMVTSSPCGSGSKRHGRLWLRAAIGWPEASGMRKLPFSVMCVLSLELFGCLWSVRQRSYPCLCVNGESHTTVFKGRHLP